MSLLITREVTSGVLLSRHGEVHRQAGRQTGCSQPLRTNTFATVSHAQVIVFQLSLCRICYPHQHGGAR